MKKKNKKAVELNVTTIIIVILAVLALVIIALSFTGGMSKLWEQIIGIWGGQTGVEEANLVETCKFYITTDNKYGFCEATQLVRGRGETPMTCEELLNARNEQGLIPAGFCETS